MKSRYAVSAGAIWLVAGLMGAAVAYASPADEQQIRDLIAGESNAIRALDNAKLATYFCDQYRGEVQSKTADDQIPPISQAAELGSGTLTAVMSAAGVSDPTSHSVINAVQSGDDAAYHSSVKQAVREVLAGVTYDVHDINVTGNTATAGVTAEGHGVTANQDRDFVQEKGQWKDCTDPDKKADTQGNPLLTAFLH